MAPTVLRDTSEEVSYLIRVTDWSPSFSFGLPWIDQGDPFFETREMTIHGRLLVPDMQNVDNCSIELYLFPELNRTNKRYKLQPNSVGHLEVYQRQLLGNLDVPEELRDTLATCLSARKIRLIVLRGTPLWRNKATINFYSFEPEEDPVYLEEAKEAWRARKSRRR